MKPDWPEVINILGKTLKLQGNFDDAIGTFRQAIKVRPTLADSHVNLGDALLEAGELDQAIACYRRAMTVSMDPRFASRLVYALHLHPDATPRRLYEAALRWTQTRTELITVQVPIHPHFRRCAGLSTENLSHSIAVCQQGQDFRTPVCSQNAGDSNI